MQAIEFLSDCPECQAHLYANWSVILEACASVGIENNMDTKDELQRYVSWYHANSHKGA